MEYKAKWNYYNRKIICYEKYQGTIYKEIIINDKQFIIVKFIKNNQIKYGCVQWNGIRWCPFSSKNNPREALNRIKRLVFDNEEE